MAGKKEGFVRAPRKPETGEGGQDEERKAKMRLEESN